MIIVVDVYYTDNRAKTVGILFRNWDDAEPLDIIAAYTDNSLEYEPGSFYKRELPCIQSLLANGELDQLNAIIVDGYVYLSDDKKPGLGYYISFVAEQEGKVVGSIFFA